MRLRELQKQKMHDLGWYLLGFLAVQLGLAVGIDRYWLAVRDPAFDIQQRIVRAHHGQADPRPLVLAFGSSRTRMALRAESLNVPADARAPVVINCGVDAAGPMMYFVELRRWLKAGIRPDLVFVEIMPLALSIRQGAPIEERNLPACRFTLAELARVRPYYAEPYRLFWSWGRARALPSYVYQWELRDKLGLDVAAASHSVSVERDNYGWTAAPRAQSAQEVQRRIRDNLGWYESALSQPAVAPRTLQAYRDVVKTCRDNHIAVALIVPPEGSAFRSFNPAVAQSHMEAVRSLTRELTVPLIDASTWVDDDRFFDGHHTSEEGADQYTRRFAREALAPCLAARPR